MAIDPASIFCDYDDGHQAVAFVRESFILGRWEPCCREHTQHFEASPHAKYQVVYLEHGHDPARRPDPADVVPAADRPGPDDGLTTETP